MARGRSPTRGEHRDARDGVPTRRVRTIVAVAASARADRAPVVPVPPIHPGFFRVWSAPPHRTHALTFAPQTARSTHQQPSQKTFKIKQKLGKKQKQNRPLPQWVRMRTGNTIRYAPIFKIPPLSRVTGKKLLLVFRVPRPVDHELTTHVSPPSLNPSGTTPSAATGAAPSSTSKSFDFVSMELGV